MTDEQQQEIEVGKTIKVAHANIDRALARGPEPAASSPADDLCSAFNAAAWSSARAALSRID